MATYTPPTKDQSIYNSSNWSSSSSSSTLSLATAKGLFLSLSGNQTVTGAVKFQGGIQTDTIEPETTSSGTATTSTINVEDSAQRLVITPYALQVVPVTDSSGTNVIDFTAIEVAGSNQQVQFNDSGAFGGSSSFLFNKSTGQVSATSVNVTDNFYINGVEFTGGSGSVSAGGSNTQIQYNSSGSLAGSSLLTFDGSALTAPATVYMSNGSSSLAPAKLVYTKDSSNKCTLGFYLQAPNMSSYNPMFKITSNGGSAYINLPQVGAGYSSAALFDTDGNLTRSGSIINSGGYIGIGKSSGISYPLDVGGDINLSGSLRINGVAQSFGGGSPGGSDTQVQFNDGGSFAGDSNFLYSKTTGQIAVSSVNVSDNFYVNGVALTTSSPGGSNTYLQYNNNGSFGASSKMTFDGTKLSLNCPLSITSTNYITFTAGGRLTTASGSSLFLNNDKTSGDCHINTGSSSSNTYIDNGSLYVTSGNLTLSSGSVGINQTSPSYALDVSGDVNLTGSLRVNGVAQSFGSSSSVGSSTFSDTITSYKPSSSTFYTAGSVQTLYTFTMSNTGWYYVQAQVVPNYTSGPSTLYMNLQVKTTTPTTFDYSQIANMVYNVAGSIATISGMLQITSTSQKIYLLVTASTSFQILPYTTSSASGTLVRWIKMG